MAVRSLGFRIEDLGYRIFCLWERFGHWGSGLGISIRGFQSPRVRADRNPAESGSVGFSW